MKQQHSLTTQEYTEIIKAITPIFLALMGGLIGVFALVSPDVDTTKLTSAMGLSGTAIAGASGLAQSSKNGANLNQEDN